MSEHLRSAESHNHASTAELEKLASERLKPAERKSERLPRHEQIEKAREHLKQAEHKTKAHETQKPDEPVRRPVLTKTLNYTQTLSSLQHRLKPAQRQFSRFIHSPAVERTSEVLGKTVMRPSVSLGAVSCAVLVVGLLYFYARANGFLLRGSELVISLVVGGLIGLMCEGIYKLVRRARGHLN